MPTYNITPVPAPRQSRSDRWKQRPCVVRYRAFRDEIKEQGVEFDNHDSVTFYMPMAKSWSEKKKYSMQGMPHTQKPDADNLLKALLDSIHKEDAHIYAISGVYKFWDYEGSIEINKGE